MVEALTTTLRRLPIWLALVAFPYSGLAHQLDEYLQATLVTIEPDGIRLQINLTPGMAVAAPVLALMDHNHDGAISPNEAAAYTEFFKRDLTLRLDERPLDLKCTASEFPPADELRTGWGIIQLEYTAAPSSFTSGAHELVFENRHQTNLSVYLVNAALPKSSAIQITRQTRNENQTAGRIEFTFQPQQSSRAKILVPTWAILLIAVVVGVAIWRKQTTEQP